MNGFREKKWTRSKAFVAVGCGAVLAVGGLVVLVGYLLGLNNGFGGPAGPAENIVGLVLMTAYGALHVWAGLDWLKKKPRPK
ncbi:MAG: hypothetical protein WD847_21255 [Pirellulales bacterium]